MRISFLARSSTVWRSGQCDLVCSEIPKKNPHPLSGVEFPSEPWAPPLPPRWRLDGKARRFMQARSGSCRTARMPLAAVHAPAFGVKNNRAG